jgi:hypothetical protein
MSIRKYGRYWAVYDGAGALVCVCIRRAPPKWCGDWQSANLVPQILHRI